MDIVKFERILKRVVADIEPKIGKGGVPRHIETLAAVDARQFGIALHTVDGQLFTAGAAHRRFPIQNISELFSLALACSLLGDELWARIDRKLPAGAFNLLAQLDDEHGKPRNPSVTADALVVMDVLASHFSRPELAIIQFMRRLARDDSIDAQHGMTHDERHTWHRNIATAHLVKSVGNLENSVDEVIRSYCHQCSIMMSCAQLAMAGAFLSNSGACTATGTHIVTANHAKRINALMAMCGTHDAAGDFAYRLGLPARSSVSGGIFAVVPGRATICVWCPDLDAGGNSYAGCMALERLVDITGWSIF